MTMTKNNMKAFKKSLILLSLLPLLGAGCQFGSPQPTVQDTGAIKAPVVNKVVPQPVPVVEEPEPVPITPPAPATPPPGSSAECIQAIEDRVEVCVQREDPAKCITWGEEAKLSC